jgi:hypothetical protein
LLFCASIGHKANTGIEQPSDKEESLWIFTAPSERTGGLLRDRQEWLTNMTDSIFHRLERREDDIVFS